MICVARLNHYFLKLFLFPPILYISSLFLVELIIFRILILKFELLILMLSGSQSNFIWLHFFPLFTLTASPLLRDNRHSLGSKLARDVLTALTWELCSFMWLRRMSLLCFTILFRGHHMVWGARLASPGKSVNTSLTLRPSEGFNGCHEEVDNSKVGLRLHSAYAARVDAFIFWCRCNYLFNEDTILSDQLKLYSNNSFDAWSNDHAPSRCIHYCPLQRSIEDSPPFFFRLLIIYTP